MAVKMKMVVESFDLNIINTPIDVNYTLSVPIPSAMAKDFLQSQARYLARQSEIVKMTKEVQDRQ
jgi:hypothetical protein